MGVVKSEKFCFDFSKHPKYDQMESLVFSGLTDRRVSRASNLLQLSFSISSSLN